MNALWKAYPTHDEPKLDEYAVNKYLPQGYHNVEDIC